MRKLALATATLYLLACSCFTFVSINQTQIIPMTTNGLAAIGSLIASIIWFCNYTRERRREM